MGDFDTVFGITPPGVEERAIVNSVLWCCLRPAGCFINHAFPPKLI